MLNIIKNFFKNKQKSTSDEGDTPSKKLWDDIQRDYYRCDELGNCKLFDKKGFLNKELLVNGNKYYVVPSNLASGTFQLSVKDEADQEVFLVEMLYGPRISNSNQHILYISKFYRLTDCRCGIGKEMAEYIRVMAENRGFDIIGVHAVAEPNAHKDAMTQDQLEDFYRIYLNGINVSLEFMSNSDEVGCF